MRTPSNVSDLYRSQRDRLLQRADRLSRYCDERKRARRAGAATPAKDVRFAKVASRLRAFVAGVGREGERFPLIAKAMQRHIDGITGYAEWLDELRWAGMSATPENTRLTAAQKAERQENLNRIEGRAA